MNHRMVDIPLYEALSVARFTPDIWTPIHLDTLAESYVDVSN